MPMDTVVYILPIDELRGENTFRRAFDALFYEDRRRKIESSRQEEDKRLRLGLGLLIEYAFTLHGIGRPIVYHGKYGKPRLADEKERGFYFNGAHGGEIAVLAVSNKEVGVDVEPRRPVSERLLKKTLTEEELGKVKRGERDFFHYWTKKESYAKYLGGGVWELLSKEGMQEEGVAFTWREEGENLLCVCSEKGEKVDFKKVSLEEILSTIGK